MLASDHSQCRGLLSARQDGSPQPMDNPASCRGTSCRPQIDTALHKGLGGVLESTGRCTKDVKIVGTNSTKPFIISKTSKKRTQNELKNGAKKHATSTQLLPMRRERPSGRIGSAIWSMMVQGRTRR